jgi:hypothetical protein
LADLIGMGTPTFVRDGARRSDGGVAERGGEIFHQLEVLGRAQSTAAGDDHRRLAEIQLPLRAFDDLLDHDALDAGIRRRRHALGARRARVLLGREGGWAKRKHRWRSFHVERHDDLVRVAWVLDGDRVARGAERDDVGRDRRVESRGDARPEVAPLRREWKEHRAVA